MRQTAPAACLLLLGLSAPLAAQEVGINAYLGFDATTNYVFRGITQTDDKPALQPYVELEASGLGPGALYGGLWASNVDFGETEIELDYYAGYRGDAGPVTYDFGYVRYAYTDTGDCCGEGYVRLAVVPAEAVALSVAYYRDFDLETDYVSAGAGVELPYDLELSGGVGKYAEDGGPWDWNVGVGYALTETISADARYHNSEAGDWIVNATLSFDTDWSSLTGR